MGDLIYPKPQEFTADQIQSDPVLRYFHYAHLPPVLKAISAPFCALAATIVAELPRNPERTVALRKLLEAKDAAVRANIPNAPGRPETFFDRLLTESRDLETRYEKLGEFLDTDAYRTLPPIEQTALAEQHEAMGTYREILGQRIARLGSGTARKLADEAPVDGEIRTTGNNVEGDPIPFRE